MQKRNQGAASSFQLFDYNQVRVGVVGNISACHADAPGSIPGHGVDFFFSNVYFSNVVAIRPE